jgi:hypothetical protein
MADQNQNQTTGSPSQNRGSQGQDTSRGAGTAGTTGAGTMGGGIPGQAGTAGHGVAGTTYGTTGGTQADPETERGGSAATHSTSRTNEDESRAGSS